MGYAKNNSKGTKLIVLPPNIHWKEENKIINVRFFILVPDIQCSCSGSFSDYLVTMRAWLMHIALGSMICILGSAILPAYQCLTHYGQCSLVQDLCGNRCGCETEPHDLESSGTEYTALEGWYHRSFLEPKPMRTLSEIVCLKH